MATYSINTPDRPISSSVGRSEAPDPLLPLLDCLRTTGGFSFHAYQRAHLGRRVAFRMSRLGITDLETYSAYLRRTPDECDALCHTIWINMTGFFRDPPVWYSLRTHLATLLQSRWMSDDLLNIWCAGCASGQEAYSLAMLFLEELGPEVAGRRIRILATDVDEEALVEARLGIYLDHDVASIPDDMRDRHFERKDGEWHVSETLRRIVTFQRHNLLRPRPQRIFDMITCRNTLMYFCPEAQVRVLARLRASLAADGLLLLGRVETPMAYDCNRAYPDRFRAVDLEARLYIPGLAHIPEVCAVDL